MCSFIQAAYSSIFPVLQEAKRANAGEAQLQQDRHMQTVRALESRVSQLEQQLSTRDARLSELHLQCDSATQHAQTSQREFNRLAREAEESKAQLDELYRLRRTLSGLQVFLNSQPQCEPEDSDIRPLRDDGAAVAKLWSDNWLAPCKFIVPWLLLNACA